MFSDLNLNVTNLPKKSIDQLVEHAIMCKTTTVLAFFELLNLYLRCYFKVGYENLGLAIDFEFPVVVKELGPKSGKKEQKPQITVPSAVPYEMPDKLKHRLKLLSRKINIYTRINIKIKSADINTYLHHLKSKPVSTYDLVAFEPADNQVLLYLCTNNFNADIISINSGIECSLTDKHLLRPLNNAVSSFSLTFELNYNASISSSIERRDLIMAGRCLTFNTKSKGLILSSRASNRINLRGPYELQNLAKLFDISDQESHQILREGPQKAIMNSFCRKHTSAGMVYFNEPKDVVNLEQALLMYKSKLEQSHSSTEPMESTNNTSPKKMKV